LNIDNSAATAFVILSQNKSTKLPSTLQAFVIVPNMFLTPAVVSLFFVYPVTFTGAPVLNVITEDEIVVCPVSFRLPCNDLYGFVWVL
jgi:hypothetical protein